MTSVSAPSAAASRRLRRILQHTKQSTLQLNIVRSNHTSARQVQGIDNTDDQPDILTIGDVQHTLPALSTIARPDLIPALSADPQLDTQEALHTLRWCLQKYQLNQDVFLIGPPGPLRRQLALKFASLIRSEVEYLPITRDTTEADLKQRAEVVDGTLHYVDQPPVRAAVHGRILIIEGIEKAERNVLPTLNNLLENREMLLDDGSFLMSTKQYDSLLQSGTMTPEQFKEQKLIRVHPNFRVIALGLPIPRFVGYSLDPPLRSRFQARSVAAPSIGSMIDALETRYSNVSRTIISNLVGFYHTLHLLSQPSTSNSHQTLQMKFPYFSTVAFDHIVATLSLFQSHDTQHTVLTDALIRRVYPYHLLCDRTQIHTIYAAMQKFNIRRETGADTSKADGSVTVPTQPLRFSGFLPSKHPNVLCCNFLSTHDSATVYLHVPSPAAAVQAATPPVKGGTKSVKVQRQQFVLTPFHNQILGPLIQDLALNKDICLMGSKGVGKTVLVQYLAHTLGYTANNIYTVHLFKDMTSRDLLQRRTTDAKGNTIWINSVVIEAAIKGGLLILDNFHTLPSYMLHAIRTLIEDRSVSLYDGTRLVKQEHYEQLLRSTPAEKLKALKIYPVSPHFHIIALAVSPPAKDSPVGSSSASLSQQWLLEETASLFSFHYLSDMTRDTQLQIVQSMFPSIDKRITESLVSLAAIDDSTPADANTSRQPLQLSLRQLIRLIRHYQSYPQELAQNIHRTLLASFMPHTLRDTVEHQIDNFVRKLDLPTYDSKTIVEGVKQPPEVKDDQLVIDKITYPINKPQVPSLVPHILFHDIPSQTAILRDMLKDFLIGEHSLLLIGNQGVGKNKLVDRLCELLQFEREYMQLHRDTTVQALTLSPTLLNGRVIYEDSPLVKAVTYGRVLVIDEADKAPNEVVSILKGLVEDGQMELSDGRTIVRTIAPNITNKQNLIQIHPNFKLLVLANRPGFPFLGNDFFRECGDVFVCHVIDNPDKESEMKLLTSYAPNVPTEIIHKLIDVFTALRVQVLEGTFAYPYSTRELVAIVKHLEKYHADGLLLALDNVIAFDSWDPQLMNNLIEIFNRYGIPLSDSLRSNAGAKVQLAKPEKLPPPRLVSKWSTNSVAANKTSARQLHTNATSSSSPYQTSTSIHPVTGRQFYIEMQSNRSTEQVEQKRIDRFTEEKVTFKAAFSRYSTPIGTTTLPDASIVMLVTDPATLYCFIAKKDYTKHHVLELDTFLPQWDIPTSSCKLFAMSDDTVAVYAPTVAMLLTIRIPTDEKTVATEFGAVESLGSKRASVVACVLPLQGSKLDTSKQRSMTSTLIDYVQPGFKSPLWHQRSTANKDEAQQQQPVLVESLAGQGYLWWYIPGDSVLHALDVSRKAEAEQLQSSQQIQDQRVTKQRTPVGLMHRIQLPIDIKVQQLICLSPQLIIIETVNGKRYMLHSQRNQQQQNTNIADNSSIDDLELTPIADVGEADIQTALLSAHGQQYRSGWQVDVTPDRHRLQQQVDAISQNVGEIEALPASVERGKPVNDALLEYDDVPAVKPSSSDAGLPSRISSLLLPAAFASAAQKATGRLQNLIQGGNHTATPVTQQQGQQLDQATSTSLQSLFHISTSNPAAVTNSKVEQTLLYEVQTAAQQHQNIEFHTVLSTYFPQSSQLVIPAKISYSVDPSHDDNSERQQEMPTGVYIAVVNLRAYDVRYIRVTPDTNDEKRAIPIERMSGSLGALQQYQPSNYTDSDKSSSINVSTTPMVTAITSTPAGDLVTLQSNGRVRVFEIDPLKLAQSVSIFRRLFGDVGVKDAKLRVDVSKDGKTRFEPTAPKQGKVDEKGEQHVGGNTWRGGSGGTDTAGLGGKAGPYRVDGGHKVNQISDEEKKRVSKEVLAAARAMAEEEMQKRLKEIDLGSGENEMYEQYYGKVHRQIHQLRMILEQAETKNQERTWMRNQNQGDLDDSKLVDARVGEKLVYRKRGTATPELGSPQRLPKRLHFVMDVSGSMYRFNGSDQRLSRLLESTLLIMEAFDGFEGKYDYSIVGHSGDAPNIQFVPYGSPPKNRKERLKILQRMYVHTQYCSSGDHTVEAIQHAVRDVTAREADEYLVIVVSDANLQRYGISPADISKAMTSGAAKVNCYVVFIASTGDEATKFLPRLPRDRSHFISDSGQLPQLFKEVFSTSHIIPE